MNSPTSKPKASHKLLQHSLPRSNRYSNLPEPDQNLVHEHNIIVLIHSSRLGSEWGRLGPTTKKFMSPARITTPSLDSPSLFTG